jgi:glyoxylase-like metal-dependent hydrolase (beta-lactamase superfamily II)
MGKAPADVRAIFFTHGHNDHVTGALAFPAAATYVIEPDVAQVRGRRGSGGRGIGNIRPLRDGERLDVSGTSVEVFGAPGHTAGSAAFLVHGVLFLGDRAAGISEGTLQPNPMLSDDAAQTERSLVSLTERLMPRPRRNPTHRVRASRGCRTTRSAIELGVDAVAPVITPRRLPSVAIVRRSIITTSAIVTRSGVVGQFKIATGVFVRVVVNR